MDKMCTCVSAREPHLLDPLSLLLPLPRRPLADRVPLLPPPPQHGRIVLAVLVERKCLQREPHTARHVRRRQAKAVELCARDGGRVRHGREARRAEERRPAARPDRVECADALDEEPVGVGALGRADALEWGEERADGLDRFAVVVVAFACVGVEGFEDAREEVQVLARREEANDVDEAREEPRNVGPA